MIGKFTVDLSLIPTIVIVLMINYIVIVHMITSIIMIWCYYGYKTLNRTKLIKLISIFLSFGSTGISMQNSLLELGLCIS